MLNRFNLYRHSRFSLVYLPSGAGDTLGQQLTPKTSETIAQRDAQALSLLKKFVSQESSKIKRSDWDDRLADVRNRLIEHTMNEWKDNLPSENQKRRYSAYCNIGNQIRFAEKYTAMSGITHMHISRQRIINHKKRYAIRPMLKHTWIWLDTSKKIMDFPAVQRTTTILDFEKSHIRIYTIPGCLPVLSLSRMD